MNSTTDDQIAFSHDILVTYEDKEVSSFASSNGNDNDNGNGNGNNNGNRGDISVRGDRGFRTTSARTIADSEFYIQRAQFRRNELINHLE